MLTKRTDRTGRAYGCEIIALIKIAEYVERNHPKVVAELIQAESKKQARTK